MDVIICKCRGKCLCSQKPGHILIRKDLTTTTKKIGLDVNEILKRVDRRAKTKTSFVTGPQGQVGPQGVPADLDDICNLEMQNQALCHRIFTFDEIYGPSMFSKFDGYSINNQLYSLDSPVSQEILNKYLQQKHQIQNLDEITYQISLPSEIKKFNLKPFGYVDQKVEPNHTLASSTSETSFQLVVCGNDGASLLDCREFMDLVKGVVREICLESVADTDTDINKSINKLNNDKCIGNVILDDKGEAIVNIPLNMSDQLYNYQITPIGFNSLIYIKSEVSDGKFIIGGGKPGGKVSWQLIGLDE